MNPQSVSWWCHRAIEISFIALLTAVPLFYLPLNYELFEFNKMILVYALTVIIAGGWITLMIAKGQVIFKSTPLDIPIGLFLLAMILSTFFSIDTHTSIFGYYTRSHGGLLSTIAYIVLYYALITHISQKDKIIRLVILGGISAFLVGLWGALQHWGVDAQYWVQDVQSRVFSTIGQPNWLAAYLAMALPPALMFFPTLSSWSKAIFLIIVCSTFYATFIFTYSRGGALGLATAGLVLTGLLLFLRTDQSVKKAIILIISTTALAVMGYGFFTTQPWVIYAPVATLLTTLSAQAIFFPGVKKYALAQAAIFLFLSLTFANPASYRLAEQKAPSPTETGFAAASPSATLAQLPAKVETANIRLIVWKGAWEIFKHYPVFGSGVETFAYSYYLFRPAEHNLTSEWDFLYNKAHNEYLNYLATTGAVGFAAYMLMIGFALFQGTKAIIKTQSDKDNSHAWLLVGLMAGYISYLAQNLFSFSVVVIAVLFWLYPAFSVILATNIAPLKKKSFTHPQLATVGQSAGLVQETLPSSLTNWQLFFILLTLAASLWSLTTLGKMWWADKNFALGYNASRSGELSKSLDHFITAVTFNPREPFYHSELAYASASLAPAVFDQDATTSAFLEQLALSESDIALSISPYNLNYLKNQINIYLNLSELDPSYLDKTDQAHQRVLKVAPTEAKSHYDYARFLWILGEKEKAIEMFQKTIELKPDYREARLSLADHLQETSQTKAAIDQLRYILQYIDSNDQLAQEKLKQWSNQ